MKVYRILPDVNRYQSFLPHDEQVWQSGQLAFDCRTKSQGWEPPNVYVLHPKLERGNFFYLAPGTLVVDSYVVDRIGDLFEMSGELLPLRHDKELFYVFNVTECVNVLNDVATQWVHGKSTRARIRIERYEFYEKRFVESPFFKIPQTCRTEILTVSDMQGEVFDFKLRYEQEKFSGLKFEEIWRGGA